MVSWGEKGGGEEMSRDQERGLQRVPVRLREILFCPRCSKVMIFRGYEKDPICGPARYFECALELCGQWWVENGAKDDEGRKLVTLIQDPFFLSNPR